MALKARLKNLELDVLDSGELLEKLSFCLCGKRVNCAVLWLRIILAAGQEGTAVIGRGRESLTRGCGNGKEQVDWEPTWE